MPTPGDDGPSVFSKYIDGPENERPSPLEKMIQQSRRHADLKIFLMDILASGPVLATLVEKRGAVHGFTEKQIRHAREQMNIIAFKEVGKTHGRWFWVLPHDNRSIPAQRATPSTIRF
jgi:hypothetical protein